MKLQVLSDIHVEFRADKPFQIPPSDAHVIVFGGDIGEGLQGITWAADQSQRVGKQVLYVAGNHEYYVENPLRGYTGTLMHLSTSFDETINGTRVISNQLGYPGERNHGFDPHKVIEI